MVRTKFVKVQLHVLAEKTSRLLELIYMDIDKIPRLPLFVLANNILTIYVYINVYVIKMEGTMPVGTGNEARPISNSQ